MKYVVVASILVFIALVLTLFWYGCLCSKKSVGMIDHISMAVNNFDESVYFYDTTLAILGYKRLMTFENEVRRAALYGIDKPYFSIAHPGRNTKELIGNAQGVHFAFHAPSHAAVDAWYTKAIELGGTDNGKPGLRPEYHAQYYAAFIIDPNGWRIEAVCHT